MDTALPFARPMLERARLSRDPRFDGRFYLAVVSTGIYCRPVCPAAPAARARHVRYFLTAAAAHEAGFRPCRRCRPETAPGTPAWLGTSAVVKRALRLIEDGALDGSSVPAFAERLGLGARQLDRLFARHLGASPLALAQTRRLHFAKHLLDGSNLPLSEIALAAGYGSLRRFNASLRGAYGCPPRELRRKRVQATPAGEVSLTLAYRPPYDWLRLSTFLQFRAIPSIETCAEGSYRRLLRVGGALALIQVQPLPGCDALELRVRGAPPTALLQIAGAARRVFDLTADPGRIAADLGTDRQLRALVRRRPGLRIPGAWDPFECAVRAVLGQQVSVSAARTLATRLTERFGAPVNPPLAGLTRLFPTPQALAEGNFERLGITAARIEALRELARAVLAGRVEFDAEPEALAGQISALRGFGAWTAQYVALRALGEPDALPEGDLVLRRTADARRALTVQELHRRAESWRPWRGYATLHLWCAATEGASSERAR
jgi:AraC family transcriptional regulator of adaptative response / DNA-3-methyladenine glycosylase II